MKSGRIGIGLLGLGIVGSAVAEALATNAAYAARAGAHLELRGALVRDRQRQRSARLRDLALTTDADALLDDPAVAIIVELMGGEEPAYTYLRRALAAGKHVVTANKEVIAKYGGELSALAAVNNVALRYEASVGGGIPLIAVLQRDFLANEISNVAAIINGTTNYILTSMAKDGIDFAEALAQAQHLGYAEADPRNDIEGIDAAYKLAILAGLAFRTPVHVADVFHEGITGLRARDFRYASELGYAVKLLAIAKRTPAGIQARVHPALVQQDEPLAKVDGVFNAIQIEGDLSGAVMIQGRGAGPGPTASAVIADILEVSRNLREGRTPLAAISGASAVPVPLVPMQELRTRYYVRMSMADRPGVLARVAQVLGEEGISIASMIQKEVDEDAGSAEVVIMTHHAVERAFQRAIARVADLDTVPEVGTFVRVMEKV
ncbi:MAG: homoserine dehydrogenase [Dehalococcoidia bacterium]|nr:homoserine dehydrogenase [Dehalococcoidia bacterium]